MSEELTLLPLRLIDAAEQITARGRSVPYNCKHCNHFRPDGTGAGHCTIQRRLQHNCHVKVREDNHSRDRGQLPPIQQVPAMLGQRTPFWRAIWTARLRGQLPMPPKDTK